jgi:heme-degrading monooxygenase HmoA
LPIQAPSANLTSPEERTEMSAWSAATWQVKDGQSAEFVKRWEELLAGAKTAGLKWAHLTQNPQDASHYLSFGEWSDEAARDAYMSRSDLQERLGRCRELCDHMAGGPVTEVASA